MIIPKNNRVYIGDCVESMKSWPDNCVDAVVTDPPYGIRFMGKAWDGADIDAMVESKKRKGTPMTGAKAGTRTDEGRAFAAGTYDLAPEAMQNFQMWTAAWAAEALRVLKPGGHLLAFASSRTYHRMAAGVEDAGFEIRDQVQWIYGSGFPKSLDVSKAIDKAAGHWRGRVGEKIRVDQNSKGDEYERTEKDDPITATATAWSGWGTALKPASEPVVVARKPLSESTVAANVLRWGTGALNIDASRIKFASEEDKAAAAAAAAQRSGRDQNENRVAYGDFNNGASSLQPYLDGMDKGRWPANLFVMHHPHCYEVEPPVWACVPSCPMRQMEVQSPGATKFFYVPKPSAGERNMGLDEDNGNFHPTVKPVDLMTYLIKLVTPPGGVVLDPFLGSGTTAIAAARLGHPWLGCELGADHAELAEKRIAAETEQGKLF